MCANISQFGGAQTLRWHIETLSSPNKATLHVFLFELLLVYSHGIQLDLSFLPLCISFGCTFLSICRSDYVDCSFASFAIQSTYRLFGNVWHLCLYSIFLSFASNWAGVSKRRMAHIPVRHTHSSVHSCSRPNASKRCCCRERQPNT